MPPDTAMPTCSGIIPAPISSFFSNCIARSTIFNSTVGTSMGRTLADPCAGRCGVYLQHLTHILLREAWTVSAKVPSSRQRQQE
jgi:hypothetical protein